MAQLTDRSTAKQSQGFDVIVESLTSTSAMRSSSGEKAAFHGGRHCEFATEPLLNEVHHRDLPPKKDYTHHRG